MTKEEKQLLLKDLSARLLYGVKLRYIEDLVTKKVSHTITLNNVYLEHIVNGDADIKPYLRPMSSMTEEELEQCRATCKNRPIGKSVLDYATIETFDWLNKNHFDYRGLIEKGLALEAPAEMYS